MRYCTMYIVPKTFDIKKFHINIYVYKKKIFTWTRYVATWYVQQTSITITYELHYGYTNVQTVKFCINKRRFLTYKLLDK